jgi:ribonuclease/clavin/mitogillin
MISQDTRERISRKDPLFFNDVTVEIASEGTVVTTWLGKEVLVMEVPGHDEGQLALYPSDRSWFIAGDLFQGIGTVVIGGEEGDMQKYFYTLERIIKLSPKVVFPSHGIGLGGTNILQKTLAHRKEREAQVLELSQKGLTPEQMLSHIYSEVRKDLWPYALENIHKHLQKLKNEGALKL